MIKSFADIGSIGVVYDTDPKLLPENAWSAGRNIRFIDNELVKSKGESAVYTTPAVDPSWLLPVQTDSTYYWVYPSLAKCYVTDGTTNTNITRQTTGADVDYSATADIGWNGGVIGGVPVINNGVDDPQMWTPQNTSTKLVSLTHSAGQTWSSQSWAARVIRPFKQFLIALDMTESSTRERQKIRWSHPADSGAVPSTWDEADTTKDAGAHYLDEGGGSLVDCLPLGDTNIIYKDSQTIGMQYIGGQFIFRFYSIFKESGLLTRRCVKPFYGKHFCVTNGDVIVHDGNTIESVLNHKTRDWLFSAIDSTNYQRTFVSPNYQKNEMWICFPNSGSSYANLALIWNFKDNTTTVRELPNVKHIGYGLVDPAGAANWNSDSETWDLDDKQWGEVDYSPTVIKNLMAGSTLFYLGDDTEQSNGTNLTCYAERTGLDFGDPNLVKYIKRVWPRLETTGDITFSVGQQMERSDAITWTDYTFSSGDAKIDVDVSGRFIAFKISSNTNVTWSCKDYDVEFEMKGRF